MALVRAAERRVSELNAQVLANTAWAFATVNRPDEELFAALARAVERQLSEFKPQGLAMTLWAFSWCEGLKGAWSLFVHTNHLVPHVRSLEAAL